MSSNAFSGRPERVAVLSADPELAERLEGARRERAESLSLARVLRRDAGAPARTRATAGTGWAY
jgi:hypothetical protein